MGPEIDGENYDYAPLFFDLLPTIPTESNEFGPLLLYTLSEPDINIDSVKLCNHYVLNKTGLLRVIHGDSSDDDAAGMISMPISALSGTDNLNPIFGIDLNPTYWNFILEESGNEIATIQASDSNSDGIIDGNDQVVFDNLEEGEYEIIIEFPAVDLTTTILFYGENPTDTIHSGTISDVNYCTTDGFGPFILTEPNEITFIVTGNDDDLVCNGQENGYAYISNAQGGTPFKQ